MAIWGRVGIFLILSFFISTPRISPADCLIMVLCALWLSCFIGVCKGYYLLMRGMVLGRIYMFLNCVYCGWLVMHSLMRRGVDDVIKFLCRRKGLTSREVTELRGHLPKNSCKNIWWNGGK